MRVKSIVLISCCFLTLSINSAFAEVEELKKALENREYQQAYDLSLKLLDENEGDPQFDYYYGISALESGHPSEAAMALERILFIYPQQHRVRLEVARAHTLMGNYDIALSHFKTVLESNPPQNVKEKIEVLIEEIERRKNALLYQYYLTIDVAAGFDTNINSATTLDEIYIPASSFPFSLSESDQSTESSFTTTKLSAGFNKNISKTRSWFVSAIFDNRTNHETSTNNTNSLNLSTGMTFKSGRTTYQIPVQLQALTMDGEEYRYGVSLSGVMSSKISDSFSISSFLQMGRGQFPSAEDKNTDQFFLGSGINYITGNFLLNATIYTSCEVPWGDGLEHNGKTSSGLRLSSTWNITPFNQAVFSFSPQTTFHDDTHPVFAKTQQDDMITASISWKHMFNRSWQMSLTGSYTNNDSNIPIYEYERAQIFAGLTWRSL